MSALGIVFLCWRFRNVGDSRPVRLKRRQRVTAIASAFVTRSSSYSMSCGRPDRDVGQNGWACRRTRRGDAARC